MTGLAPKADEVVRDAVDAFMEGRRTIDHDGETLLETKNSRYRVLDGVLFSAPDISLHGSEFVGWLCDNERRLAIETSWQPGVRAVLVDRKRGRHIIITSTIVEVSGADLDSNERDLEPSYPYALQRRRTPVPAAVQEVATPLPAPASPSIPRFPPAPTRPGPRAAAASPSAPPEPAATITAATRPPPPPPRRASLPWADARAPLHPSPRPAAIVPARPLPFPSPPPRRTVTPVPPAAFNHPPPIAPIAPAPLPRIDDPDLYSTSPDSLPMIDAPEPLPSSPATLARPVHTEEPWLLASSDVLDAVDAVDPEGALDTDEDIDDIEQTEPTSPPFLLERPATVVPPAPASQTGNEPFLLGRPVQRNAPLR